MLVQIAGGPGMTLTEVEIVMQELNRHVEDHTQILFGTSVDGKMGNRMSVTLISSLSAEDYRAKYLAAASSSADRSLRSRVVEAPPSRLHRLLPEIVATPVPEPAPEPSPNGT